MQVLAANSLIRSFESIRIVDLRKHLEFGKEAVYRISQKLAGFAVTVPLAWYLGSYWALIVGMTTSTIVGVALSYYLKPVVPSITLTQRRDVFGFSVWLFISNIATTTRNRISYFLLGRSGADVLGYFQVSQEISNDISTQLVASINRAIFPGYAKVAADAGAFKSIYLRVIAVAAIFAMPVGLGMATVAHIVVPVVLGPKWLPAIEPVQLFAMNGVILAINSNAHYVFFARDKPVVSTLITIGQITLLIPLLLLLIGPYGMSGAVTAFLIVNGLSMPVGFWLVRREIAVQMTDILRNLWRPAVAASAMALVVQGYINVYPAISIFNLTAAIAVGVIVYSVSLALLVALSEQTRSVEALLFRHFLTSRSRA
jgi:O-antigen/teichoic acid export membrane protein